VDRKRVFASGGSYGGYLVAWMNGHLPHGRYRAYVCHAGCFDWVFDDRRRFVPVFAKELGAWYWEDFGKVEAQNPRAAVKRMQTPTLVIHGALDYRVPDSQGCSTTTRSRRRKYQCVCFTSRTRTLDPQAAELAPVVPRVLRLAQALLMLGAVAPHLHEVAAARHLAPAAAAVLRFVQEQPVAGRISAAAHPLEPARVSTRPRIRRSAAGRHRARRPPAIERPRKALWRRGQPGERRCASVLDVDDPEVVASGGAAFSPREEHASQCLAELDRPREEFAAPLAASRYLRRAAWPHAICPGLRRPQANR